MEVPTDIRGHDIQAPIWNFAGGQKVAVGAGSADSDPLATEAVLLYATTDCFFRIVDAADPAAADAAGSIPLPAGHFLPMGCEAGHVVKVIQAAGAGSLFILPA